METATLLSSAGGDTDVLSFSSMYGLPLSAVEKRTSLVGFVSRITAIVSLWSELSLATFVLSALFTELVSSNSKTSLLERRA